METLEVRQVLAVWTGAAGNDNWGTPGNWDNNDVPNTAGETATFSGNDAGDVNVNGTFTIGTLSFTNAAGSDYNLQGGALNLAALNQTGTGENSIETELNGNGSFTGAVSDGSLTLSSTNNTFSASESFTVSGGADLNVVGNGNLNALDSADIDLDSGNLNYQLPGNSITDVPGQLNGRYWDFDPSTIPGGIGSGPENDGPNAFDTFAGTVDALDNQIGAPNQEFALTVDLDFPNTDNVNSGASSNGNPFDVPVNGVNTPDVGVDNIVAAWDGFFNINPGDEGTYRFDARSDDGTLVYIDGQKVVDNNAFQGNTERMGSVDLSVGEHEILIVFYEGTGGAGGRVSFQGPTSGGAEVFVNPSQVGAFGSFFFTREISGSIDADFNFSNRLTTSGNSSVNLEAAITGLTLDSLDLSGTLSVSGDQQNLTFTGQTTLQGTSDTINTDNVNVIVNDVAGAVDLVKQGNGELTLNSLNTAFTGSNTITGEDGVLRVANQGNTSALGDADIVLTDGTVELAGIPSVVTNAIAHYGFHVNDDNNALDLNNNGGIMGGGDPTSHPNFNALVSLTSGPGGRGLDFNDDGDFINSGAIGQNDNYSNLFLTTINVTATSAGGWAFDFVSDDDIVGLWVDLNQNGTFESNGTLGDDLNEQITFNDGTERTVTLAEGQYLVAATHREGGGGSQINLQVTTPTLTKRTINPTDPEQAGIFSADNIVSEANLSNDFDVLGNAGFDTGNVPGVTLSGNVEFGNGGTPNFTTIANDTLTLTDPDLLNDTTLNTIGAASTILQNLDDGAGSFSVIKTGDSRLELATDNTFDGTLTIEAGSVVAGASGALGGEANDTIVNDSGSLVLRGGITLPAGESITLNGRSQGAGDDGALRNESGDNTVLGDIVVESNSLIGLQNDTLTLNGSLTLNGDLEFDSGNVARITTVNGQVTGGGEILVTDDGFIRLTNAANDFTGEVNVTSGTVQITGEGALGDTSAGTTISGDGTVQFDGAFDHGNAELFTISGTGEGGVGALSNTGGDTMLTSEIVVAGNVSIGSEADTLTITDDLELGLANLTLTGSAGTVALTGNVTDISVNGVVPGLLVGRLGGNVSTAPNPGNEGIQLGIDFGQTDQSPPWAGNTTFVYTGQIFDADGMFSIAEQIDDKVRLSIDGTEVINNDTWNTPTTSGTVQLDFGMGPADDGWHEFELRMSNGGGGAGASGANNNWTNTFGIGLSTTGTTSVDANDYILPVDPGDASLFRIFGGSSVTKTGGSTAILSGDNNFDGAVNILGGTLVAGSDNALGTTGGGLAVVDGGSLGFSGGVTVTGEDPVVNGTGAAGRPGAVFNLDGENTFTATITAIDFQAGQVGIGAEAGTLTLDGPAIDLRFSSLQFDGAGEVSIESPISGLAVDSPGSNAFSHFGFHFDDQNAALNLNNNAGLLGGGEPTSFNNFEGHGLLINGPGGRGLDFNGDGDFRAVPANIQGGGTVIDQNDNYTNLFWATLTVSAANAGVWTFDSQGNDDQTGFWIDLDQDGILESDGTLNDNRGEQITWDDNGSRDVTLAAGEYMLAFTHREGGGGSQIDFEFSNSGSHPNLTDIRPGDVTQAGFWRPLDSIQTNGDGGTPVYTYVSFTPDNRVVKQGSGIVTLSAANTYNAGTTIEAGTLAAANANALGDVSQQVTVVDGGTLGLTGGITLANYPIQLNGLGATGQPGALVNLADDNEVISAIMVDDTIIEGDVGIGSNSGTLLISNDLDLQFSSLTVAGDGDVVIDAVVSGGGAVNFSNYPTQILNESELTSYYQLNESIGSATAVDSSPNGFDGTFQAGSEANLEAASAFPSLGTALDFDGTDDEVALATASELGIQNASFTASAWINADTLGGDKSIFGTDQTGGNQGLHLILRGNNAHFGFFGNDTGGNQTLTTGTWYHVAWRYDIDTQEQAIFIDGQLDNSSGNHGPFTGNDIVRLGTWSNADYFDGRIDEPAIIGRALTDQEILDQFNEGAAVTSGTIESELRKEGRGTLTLTAANTYNGDTTINGVLADVDGVPNAFGAVLANNTTGSATGSGNVFVDNWGTFAGTGSINGWVQTGVTGMVEVGPDLGVSPIVASNLTIGSLDLNNSIEFDITATGNDTLTVASSGMTLLDMGRLFVFLEDDTMRPTNGETFLLIDNQTSDPLAELMDENTGTILAEGDTFEIDYQLGGELRTRQFSISYTGGDGNDLVLTHINRPPVAIPATVTGSEDTDIPGDFAANDPDNDPSVAPTVTVDPANGTLADNGDGTFTYTPDAFFSGTDEFSFQANDGELSSTNTATITLNVAPDANTPNFTVADLTVDEDATIDLGVTASLVDTDGSETLDLTISGLPEGTTIEYNDGTMTTFVAPNPNSSVTIADVDQTILDTVTITPPLNDASDFTITVSATVTDTITFDDMTTASDTLTVMQDIDLTVNAVVDGVSPAMGTVTGGENTPIELLLGVSDSDEVITEVLITGVPTDADATLSLGDHEGGGTFRITDPAELSMLSTLTFTKPDGDEPNTSVTLMVSFTATDVDPDDPGNPIVVTSSPVPLIVEVENTPPTVDSISVVGGGGQTVAGFEVEFDVTVDDPNPDDGPFTLDIDWGDGTSDTFVLGVDPITHAFENFGTLTISVQATDIDGGQGPATTTTIEVVPVAVIDGDIYAGGTGNSDRIIFSPAQGGVIVRFNNVFFGPFSVNNDTRLVAFGQGGNDQIIVTGNAGAPAVFDGGVGNDYLAAQGLDDTLLGGGGNDVLLGGEGDNLLIGDDREGLVLAGSDRIEGRDGEDYIFGGGGNDRLNGGGGDDVIDGGEGNDFLFGNLGNDFLHGNEGADTINGHFGNDVLFGGGSSDQMFGSSDQDLLVGGDGRDRLRGDAGDDDLVGGTSGLDSQIEAALDAILQGTALPLLAAADSDVDDAVRGWFTGNDRTGFLGFLGNDSSDDLTGGSGGDAFHNAGDGIRDFRPGEDSQFSS